MRLEEMCEKANTPGWSIHLRIIKTPPNPGISRNGKKCLARIFNSPAKNLATPPPP
ncbi:MAG TPA: hypothetical protein VHM90_06740 [Phycisphaerae bacterium]|jgi:hypothetical protein|nr:hypothetical protein [Phycisphaerae bacterium]